MQTHNHDVRMVHNEYCRYIEETLKAQSANLAMIRDADKNRLLSYLDRMVQILDWIVAQPQVDLPESHPDIYELQEYPPLTKVENESLNMLATLFDLARKENANSSSSRAPSGMVSFDESRQRQYISKARNLLVMSDSISPVDFPESSPRADSITDGRLGIGPGN